MDILRLATAGNVDDGKSTLIGRLLFDSRAIPKDRVEEVSKLSEKKNFEGIDFALFADGLVAEREKNITIDVAHIYFYSENRKYILADSPGHLEYLRNMITAVSTADCLVLLVDASRALSEQTVRHLFIACLMGIEKVVCLINKMDLMNYEQSSFKEKVTQLKEQFDQFNPSRSSLSFVPISALKGDNVATVSQNMSWYSGPSLLTLISEVKTKKKDHPFSFFIQDVLSEKGIDYVLGRIQSGSVKKGDTLHLLGDQEAFKVDHVLKGEEVSQAAKGESISLRLDSSHELRRGMLLLGEQANFAAAKKWTCILCWLDDQSQQLPGNYLIQCGSAIQSVQIDEVQGEYSFERHEFVPWSTKELRLNQMYQLTIESDNLLPLSPNYERIHDRFILIDPNSNRTVAVGLKLLNSSPSS